MNAREQVEELLKCVTQGCSKPTVQTARTLLEGLLVYGKEALPSEIQGSCPPHFVWKKGEVELHYPIRSTATEEEILRAISRIILDLQILPPLEEALMEETELEGGAYMPLDYVEELRLTIKTFMTPPVLEALNELGKALNTKPVMTEAYSGLARRSEHGFQCRYALAYLKRFRTERLDRTIQLLEEYLEKMKEMKSERSS